MEIAIVDIADKRVRVNTPA